MVSVGATLLGALLEAASLEGVTISFHEGPGKFPAIAAGRPDTEHSDDSVTMIGDALARNSGKFVAVEAGRVVGAISFDKVDGATVYNEWSERPFESTQVIFVTNLGSVRAGVGTALMGKVDEVAEREMLPLVLSPSSWSKSFYRKLGFEIERGLAFKG